MPKLKHVFLYLFLRQVTQMNYSSLSQILQNNFPYVYVHNMHVNINKIYLYVHIYKHIQLKP